MTAGLLAAGGLLAALLLTFAVLACCPAGGLGIPAAWGAGSPHAAPACPRLPAASSTLSLSRSPCHASFVSPSVLPALGPLHRNTRCLALPPAACFPPPLLLDVPTLASFFTLHSHPPPPTGGCLGAR